MPEGALLEKMQVSVSVFRFDSPGANYSITLSQVRLLFVSNFSVYCFFILLVTSAEDSDKTFGKTIISSEDVKIRHKHITSDSAH